MAIEFACANCQEQVRVGDAAAGKMGKCPHCGSIMQIPSPGAPPETGLRPLAQSAAQAPPPARKSNNISFPCPTCARTVTAPAAMSGKRGKCPHCQGLLIIGGGALTSPAATSARAPQATAAGLTPLGDGLTPLSNDLTPLGSGLTPLGAGPMPSGGLTPLGSAPLGNALDDLPSLTPMSPIGSQSLAPAAFPSAPAFGASNPLGVPPGGYTLPSANLNPYATPYGQKRSGSGTAAPPKLLVPAIAMLSVSAITLAWLMYQLAMLLLTPMILPLRMEMELMNDPAQRETYIMAVFAVQLVIMGVVALINIGVIFGAVQMIRMRGLGAAKTGAVLGLMPCSLCCLNLPFAIWALVVLGQNDVWRQFKD